MRLRAIAAALLVGSCLLAAPAAHPPPAAAIGPLPVCRLDDILTEPRDYDDWATTLVDWNLTVGPAYKPPGRVSINDAGVTGGGQVRRVAFDDLKAMATAARKAGVPLGSVSAYRSYKTQVELFGGYVKSYGFKDAITFSARPGHSEHQLGLVIDFAAAGSTTFVNETTPTGAWLSKNAWKYGWLMSYPDGKDAVACYHYEPWHYRYVGRDLAAKIHESGLTIREYLWANFTQADTDCERPAGPTVGPTTSAPPCDPLPSPTPTEHPGATAGSATPTGASGSGPPATLGPGATPGPGTDPANILGQDPKVVVGGLMLLGVAGISLVVARRGRSRSRWSPRPVEVARPRPRPRERH